MDLERPSTIRKLKGLVIGLGILIVLGLGAVAVGVVRTIGDLGRSGPPAGGAGAAPGRFDTSHIALPPGARLIDVAAAGDRVLLRLGLADGTARIVVVDLNSGARLGTIELSPAADRTPR